MSKCHVLRKHPTAKSTRHADGWDIRAGDQLLGQGTTADDAWWDATMACYPEWGRSVAERAPVAAPAAAWPFPCSAHEEKA